MGPRPYHDPDVVATGLGRSYDPFDGNDRVDIDDQIIVSVTDSVDKHNEVPTFNRIATP